MEQQRYRQLWDERETVVTCLHSQIRQLQHDRDDYYTKYQELHVRIRLIYSCGICILIRLGANSAARLNFVKLLIMHNSICVF